MIYVVQVNTNDINEGLVGNNSLWSANGDTLLLMYNSVSNSCLTLTAVLAPATSAHCRNSMPEQIHCLKFPRHYILWAILIAVLSYHSNL